MQDKTPNNCMQGTGAAEGSCSQYKWHAQWSPPEATVGYYQETSR